jgi:hypothetical protein
MSAATPHRQWLAILCNLTPIGGHTMDKSVRRVTEVQAHDGHRESKIVYEDTDDEVEEHPRFRRLERSVRHVLKAPPPLPLVALVALEVL